MERRAFIGLSLSAAGGVALATMGLAGCGPSGAAQSAPASSAGSSAAAPAPTVSEPAAPAAPTWTAPAHISCAGDSITYGYGVDETRDVDSYPAILQALLAQNGQQTQVDNYGLCGACALSSGKNPYVDFQEYYDSLASGADMVILMLGTNDAASGLWDRATFEEELGGYVETYQQMDSQPTVVLMVPPDIFSPDWGGGVPEQTVDDMQEAVRAVAAARGLLCVDLEPVFAGHEDWFTDGVHPNAEGNANISQSIYASLSNSGQ